MKNMTKLSLYLLLAAVSAHTGIEAMRQQKRSNQWAGRPDWTQNQGREDRTRKIAVRLFNAGPTLQAGNPVVIQAANPGDFGVEIAVRDPNDSRHNIQTLSLRGIEQVTMTPNDVGFELDYTILNNPSRPNSGFRQIVDQIPVDSSIVEFYITKYNPQRNMWVMVSNVTLGTLYNNNDIGITPNPINTLESKIVQADDSFGYAAEVN